MHNIVVTNDSKVKRTKSIINNNNNNNNNNKEIIKFKSGTYDNFKR